MSDRSFLVFFLALLSCYLILYVVITVASFTDLFIFFIYSFQNAFYLVPCFGGYGREETTQLTTTELLSQELQPVTSISFYK